MKFFRLTPKRVVLGMAVCLLAAWLISVFWPLSHVSFEVSRETTYFVEPLRADGTVDYAAAINLQKPPVPPDQNAAVLLLRIRTEGLVPFPNRVFELLGTDPVPENAPFFVEAETFAISYLGGEAAEGALGLASTPSRLPKDERDRFEAAMAETLRRPWSADEFPVIAAWLKANEQPLRAMTEAADRPHWYWPCVVKPDQKIFGPHFFPALASSRQAATALINRSLLRWKQRDQTGAWRDIVAVHRVARRLADGQTLSARMIAGVMRLQASEAVFVLLRQDDLDAPLAQTMLNDLQSIEPWPDLGPALERDRLMLLDMIQQGYRSNMSAADADFLIPNELPDNGIDVNRMLRRINSYFDGCLVGANGEPVANQVASIEKVLKSSETETQHWRGGLQRATLYVAPATVRRRVASDVIADLGLNMFLSVWKGTVLLEARRNTAFDLAKVGLALHLYKAQHGHYPDTLDVLAPDHLPALPIDPFSEGPLCYRRIDDGYVLYSIGPNFADDGGKARDPDDRDDESDIVLQVE